MIDVCDVRLRGALVNLLETNQHQARTLTPNSAEIKIWVSNTPSAKQRARDNDPTGGDHPDLEPAGMKDSSNLTSCATVNSSSISK